jgi:hypothetical protein
MALVRCRHSDRAQDLIVRISEGDSKVTSLNCGFVQHSKSRSEIFLRCDGRANVTVVNLEHSPNAKSPRVEAEEGIVNEAKRGQRANAYDLIL